MPRTSPQYLLTNQSYTPTTSSPYSAYNSSILYKIYRDKHTFPGGYARAASFHMGGRFSTSRKRGLPDIYVDIESAEPKDEDERRLCESFVQNVKEPSADIFERFSQYEDGQALAAAALASPSEEARNTAWAKVLPNVQLQMEVYEFAQSLAEMFGNLLRAVIDKLDQGQTTVFEEMPALTKTLAECFDTILRLDEIKLSLPNIVNDLAYFRRNCIHYNQNNELDNVLAMSNETTIFWASPTPMLSCVIGKLTKEYPESNEAFGKLLMILGGVSDVCTSMLTNHRFENEESNKLCLRCIVGAVLMYDYLSPTGAFGTKTKFHVREAMEILVTFEPKQNALINAIKYSSKHLGDESADPKVKALF